MKKFFTFCLAVLAAMSLQAEEKVVWEGNEPISWNPDVAPGTQYETPQGIFDGLEADNVVRIYTTTTYDEPQYVVTYKKGEGWDWTDLDITTADGILTFTVADDQMAQEIADRGLIIRGQAFTLVKITVESGSNTGIAVNEESRMKNEELRDAVYDLQGRRMENAQLKKGTFIKNGKKYLVQ